MLALLSRSLCRAASRPHADLHRRCRSSGAPPEWSVRVGDLLDNLRPGLMRLAVSFHRHRLARRMRYSPGQSIGSEGGTRRTTPQERGRSGGEPADELSKTAQRKLRLTLCRSRPRNRLGRFLFQDISPEHGKGVPLSSRVEPAPGIGRADERRPSVIGPCGTPSWTRCRACKDRVVEEVGKRLTVLSTRLPAVESY